MNRIKASRTCTQIHSKQHWSENWNPSRKPVRSCWNAVATRVERRKPLIPSITLTSTLTSKKSSFYCTIQIFLRRLWILLLVLLWSWSSFSVFDSISALRLLILFRSCCVSSYHQKFSFDLLGLTFCRERLERCKDVDRLVRL